MTKKQTMINKLVFLVGGSFIAFASTYAYANRDDITLRMMAKRVPVYLGDFCECDVLITELATFSPIIVENWALLSDEHKLYILQSVKRIKLARKNAVLNGGSRLTYEEIELMIKKAKTISLNYGGPS